VADILQPHGSILRYDKPGHGLSEVVDKLLTISDYVADVVGLMDALGVQKCVFVGLSIGGIIGQQLALSHPDRIEKLVLSNTAPQIGTADGWNERISAVQQQGMTAVVEGVLNRWFPAPFQQAHPTEIPNHKSIGMKTRRAVLGDEHMDRAEADKTEFDADFQQYITENAWGSIWSRPGLSHRDRSLITIALLAALGHDEELAMHIRATRNTGVTPDEVKETLMHTAVYAGVPATNGAMKLAKEILLIS
jgi:4-carboxymuconolactone decarboxylase